MAGPPVPPPAAPSMIPPWPIAPMTRPRMSRGIRSAIRAVQAGIAVAKAMATANRISSTPVKLVVNTKRGIAANDNTSAPSKEVVRPHLSTINPGWDEHEQPYGRFNQQNKPPSG